MQIVAIADHTRVEECLPVTRHRLGMAAVELHAVFEVAVLVEGVGLARQQLLMPAFQFFIHHETADYIIV